MWLTIIHRRGSMIFTLKGPGFIQWVKAKSPMVIAQRLKSWEILGSKRYAVQIYNEYFSKNTPYYYIFVMYYDENGCRILLFLSNHQSQSRNLS